MPGGLKREAGFLNQPHYRNEIQTMLMATSRSNDNRDANTLFREANRIRDLQWALLALALFVAIDILALRLV